MQGQMTSRVEVVSDVSFQSPSQMPLSKRDHMVETFPANTSDKAFDEWILPGTLRGGEHRLNAHYLNSIAEMATVHPSRSLIKYRGAAPSEKASRICWAVHSAVGCSVTLKCTKRRRSCARTTNTNNTLNCTVDTVKKSMETNWPTWFVRKVFHVWDGFFLRFGIKRRPYVLRFQTQA